MTTTTQNSNPFAYFMGILISDVSDALPTIISIHSTCGFVIMNVEDSQAKSYQYLFQMSVPM